MDKKPRKIKVLEINNDGSLTADFQEFITIMKILKNQHKQFLTSHKRLHIPNVKI